MPNRLHDAFDAVHASEELKAGTLQFLGQVRAEREKHQMAVRWGAPAFRRAAAVCAALLLMLGAGGWFFTLAPAAYISIDVNPSVELTLNRLDRVISARAWNEDGEIVLRDVSVRGRAYGEAIDLIVGSEAMQPYLTGNAELSFTVAAASEEKQAALLNGVESCTGCRGHGGRGFSGNVELIGEAHENGMSLGKYSAYLKLLSYDESVTTDDCRGMSMSEIHSLIREHQHGSAAQAQADCTQTPATAAPAVTPEATEPQSEACESGQGKGQGGQGQGHHNGSGHNSGHE